jgi:hypothetical protein
VVELGEVGARCEREMKVVLTEANRLKSNELILALRR